MAPMDNTEHAPLLGQGRQGVTTWSRSAFAAVGLLLLVVGCVVCLTLPAFSARGIDAAALGEFAQAEPGLADGDQDNDGVLDGVPACVLPCEEQDETIAKEVKPDADGKYSCKALLHAENSACVKEKCAGSIYTKIQQAVTRACQGKASLGYGEGNGDQDGDGKIDGVPACVFPCEQEDETIATEVQPDENGKYSCKALTHAENSACVKEKCAGSTYTKIQEAVTRACQGKASLGAPIMIPGGGDGDQDNDGRLDAVPACVVACEAHDEEIAKEVDPDASGKYSCSALKAAKNSPCVKSGCSAVMMGRINAAVWRVCHGIQPST